MIGVLPDAEQAFTAEHRVQEAYRQRGGGAGMATFIALTLWHGKFTDEFGSQAPDPEAFGLPVHDDGARGEPLR